MEDKEITNNEKWIVGALSVVGGREKHEDRSAVENITTVSGLDLLVGIVADGVGSADRGGMAADTAVQTVLKSIRESKETQIPKIIVKAIKDANHNVFEQYDRGVDATTTLVVAVIHNDRLFVGNVGDSRAYYVSSSGNLIQLTKDHTYGNLAGVGPNHEKAEMVVNAIGNREQVTVDLGFYLENFDDEKARAYGLNGVALKAGDSVLLCSDGLIKSDPKNQNRYISDEEIVDIIRTEYEDRKATQRLVDTVRDRDADDNISAVTIQYITDEIVQRMRARTEEFQKKKARRRAVLYIAGIVGALLLVALGLWGSRTSQALSALSSLPTATERIVQITATPLPTLTPTPIVRVGEASIHEINGAGTLFITSDGLEYPASIGQSVPDGAVLRSERVGSRLVFGERDGGVSLFYLYPDSEMLLSYTGALSTGLTDGQLYAFPSQGNPNGQIEIQFTRFEELFASVVGGRLLTGIDDGSVWLICLEGTCRIREGREEILINPMEKAEYRPGIGLENLTLEVSYDELWQLNTQCNYCFSDLVPAPTPVPAETPFSSIRDRDGDGVVDAEDKCPSDPEKTSPGACGCGASDADSDGDGTPDCNDVCVNDPNKTSPGACGCGSPETDSDGDGTPDCNDQCKNDPNKTAPGACGCGVSDVDSDGDGTPDCNDLCKNDPNKTEPGTCGCGTPDVDSDGDGFLDCQDACPDDSGPDGGCPAAPPPNDDDEDGVKNSQDNCPNVYNPGQEDSDNDGIGDACDSD